MGRNTDYAAVCFLLMFGLIILGLIIEGVKLLFRSLFA
jgi:hypothetical protein